MMGRTIEVVGLDERIVETIRTIRAKVRACTARQLAYELGYHHTYISARLQRLQREGLVDFDAKIPGSIHTTDTHEVLIETGQAVDTTVSPASTPERTPDQVKLGVDPAKIEAHRARMAAEAAAAALGTPVAPTATTPAKKTPAKKKAPAAKKATGA